MARTAQEEARLKRIAYEFQHGRPDGVQVNVCLNLNMIDTVHLSDKQIKALLNGIAGCIAAEKHEIKPN